MIVLAAPKQQRLSSQVPYAHVGVIASLPGGCQVAVRAQSKARHGLVVPAQEHLVVRIRKVADDYSRTSGIDD